MARAAVGRKARRPARVLAKGKAVAAPRAVRQVERREAILNAALDEFAARGFAATRLEDVAARAGIAKGTIYLYFHSKQSLFQELVRTALSPVVGKVLDAGLGQLPVRAVGEAVADLFIREIFGTRRKDVIRLVIAEGPRFPKIAEFYYHEVIERVVPAMRAVMENALARGELKDAALARFPQLLVAPGLLALIWEALFGRFAPLDVAALMRAHIDLLFAKGRPQ